MRFELRQPRVRVETRGEVRGQRARGSAASASSICRRKTARQINAWIFGNLLEEAALQHGSGIRFLGDRCILESDAAERRRWVDGFRGSGQGDRVADEPDPFRNRLRRAMIASVKRFPARRAAIGLAVAAAVGPQLVWTINTLVVVAALLLFALVFLSVTGSLHDGRWPWRVRPRFLSGRCIGDFFGCSEGQVRARDWPAWLDGMLRMTKRPSSFSLN